MMLVYYLILGVIVSISAIFLIMALYGIFGMHFDYSKPIKINSISKSETTIDANEDTDVDIDDEIVHDLNNDNDIYDIGDIGYYD